MFRAAVPVEADAPPAPPDEQDVDVDVVVTGCETTTDAPPVKLDDDTVADPEAEDVVVTALMSPEFSSVHSVCLIKTPFKWLACDDLKADEIPTRIRPVLDAVYEGKKAEGE